MGPKNSLTEGLRGPKPARLLTGRNAGKAFRGPFPTERSMAGYKPRCRWDAFRVARILKRELRRGRPAPFATSLGTTPPLRFDSLPLRQSWIHPCLLVSMSPSRPMSPFSSEYIKKRSPAESIMQTWSTVTRFHQRNNVPGNVHSKNN